MIAHRLIAAVVFALMTVAVSQSAIILFDNSVGSTTGAPKILSLQNKGKATTESGGVFWNGTQDVTTGDAQGGSQTLTAATVFALSGFNPTSNANEFALLLDVNQNQGQDLGVTDFTAIFFGADGSTLFTADFSGALSLADSAPNQGYRFIVQFSPAEAGLFFGNPNNRLGLDVPAGSPFTNANAGPESFFASTSPGADEPVVIEGNAIPEPGSIAIFGVVVGFGALAARLRRRSG